MRQQLARQDFRAADGIGQQQGQGAAFDLARDGVKAHQQGDQRHQIDRQRGQRGHDHRQPVGADVARGRGACGGQD